MSPGPYGDKPACLVIAICNEVIEDKRSNNKSLIGLFSNINVVSIPAAHPRLFLIVSLTNLPQETALRVLLRNPQGGEARFENNVRADNPELVLDMVMQLDSLALPVLGRYTFEVWAGDLFLAARSFNVSMAQAQPQQANPGFPTVSGEVGSA